MLNPIDVAMFLDGMRKSAGLGLTVVFCFVVLGPAWFTPLDCTGGLPQQPTIINPDPEPTVNCKNIFGAPISGTIGATFGDATRNTIISGAIGLAIWAALGLYNAYTDRSTTAGGE